jgi:hypothetical protein
MTIRYMTSSEVRGVFGNLVCTESNNTSASHFCRWVTCFHSFVGLHCLTKGGAVAQAVICTLHTAADRVRFQVKSFGICGGQSGTEACFLRVVRFLLPILIPPIAPHSSSVGWYSRPNSFRRTISPRLKKLTTRDDGGRIGYVDECNEKKHLQLKYRSALLLRLTIVIWI